MNQSLHPDLERQLIGGADLLREAKNAAQYLSVIMQEIHGGEWDISVNHENCFVLVARDFSDRKGAAA
ncbi:hypothetical protein [Rhizobium sp. Root651]|uniref:hypothetical protein n=1 Tax=Rhizobium sp. Root651 TaxID=1736577 RepID=UPI000713257C|nr:hypothetical protein [Rhizobium sp. Root651]KRA58996.1 hypothetical protein ASD85_15010 [Rhizobium sp. Root651]